MTSELQLSAFSSPGISRRRRLSQTDSVGALIHIHPSWTHWTTGFNLITGTVEDKGKESLEGEFTFSHIDPNDRSRAVFRETEGEGEEGLHARLSKHYKVLFRKGLPVDKPKFYVQIRLFANDTLIPVVKADWDALELTVDWKDMYTEWFREAKEHDRRLGLYVRDLNAFVFYLATEVDVAPAGGKCQDQN